MLGLSMYTLMTDGDFSSLSLLEGMTEVPRFRVFDEALAGHYPVSLKDANLSVVLLELQQRLMREECDFDFVDYGESHDGIIGECQIHHRESYGHCSAFVSLPHPYKEYDCSQR